MQNSPHLNKNLNANELVKFAKMAKHWWNPNGQCRPLHDLNPLRMSFISIQCGDLYNRQILDVGCGGGIVSESLARSGAHVTGIDMTADLLEVACLHAQQSQLKINYQLLTIEELAAKQCQYYDIITCLEMLEHVPDPAKVIQQCAHLLKPDGHLVISTINRTLKARALAIGIAEYLLKLLPKGTHQFNAFIKPSELTAWSRAANFDDFTLRGLRYNPLLRKAQLTHDVSVNYLVHCRQANELLV